MTGVERAAQKVVRAARGGAATVVDFGTVQVLKGSGIATVSGITLEPLQVSTWSAGFRAEVAAAGGALSGKRVLVLFKDGQPTIMTTVEG